MDKFRPQSHNPENPAEGPQGKAKGLEPEEKFAGIPVMGRQFQNTGANQKASAALADTRQDHSHDLKLGTSIVTPDAQAHSHHGEVHGNVQNNFDESAGFRHRMPKLQENHAVGELPNKNNPDAKGLDKFKTADNTKFEQLRHKELFKKDYSHHTGDYHGNNIVVGQTRLDNAHLLEKEDGHIHLQAAGEAGATLVAGRYENAFKHGSGSKTDLKGSAELGANVAGELEFKKSNKDGKEGFAAHAALDANAGFRASGEAEHTLANGKTSFGASGGVRSGVFSNNDASAVLDRESRSAYIRANSSNFAGAVGGSANVSARHGPLKATAGVYGSTLSAGAGAGFSAGMDQGIIHMRGNLGADLLAAGAGVNVGLSYDANQHLDNLADRENRKTNPNYQEKYRQPRPDAETIGAYQRKAFDQTRYAEEANTPENIAAHQSMQQMVNSDMKKYAEQNTVLKPDGTHSSVPKYLTGRSSKEDKKMLDNAVKNFNTNEVVNIPSSSMDLDFSNFGK